MLPFPPIFHVACELLPPACSSTTTAIWPNFANVFVSPAPFHDHFPLFRWFSWELQLPHPWEISDFAVIPKLSLAMNFSFLRIACHLLAFRCMWTSRALSAVLQHWGHSILPWILFFFGKYFQGRGNWMVVAREFHRLFLLLQSMPKECQKYCCWERDWTWLCFLRLSWSP